MVAIVSAHNLKVRGEMMMMIMVMVGVAVMVVVDIK